MKILLITLAIAIVLTAGIYLLITNGEDYVNPNEQEANSVSTPETSEEAALADLVTVTSISHATAVLEWDDGQIIYTDPVGGAEAFSDQKRPDVILLTDIHGDHLSTSTLRDIVTATTTIIAPQAVAELLSTDLRARTIVLANGTSTNQKGFMIEAIPMYNLPESSASRHPKGRGNGYVVEKDGTRVYIAGDTSDIAEMRALQDIDIAFVPMNPPFTMTVESAADAVLDFAPKIVYPYHYRGEEGLSNIDQFKTLVNAGNPNIEVRLLDWYPKPLD